MAEKVTFLTAEHRYTTFLVKRSVEVTERLRDGMEVHKFLAPDKKAAFRNGMFSTDDPEIITFLDKRADVWRSNDPAAQLKFTYGANVVDEIADALRTQMSAKGPIEET